MSVQGHARHVQPGQIGIGRQPGITHRLAGIFPIDAFPQGTEAEVLLGLCGHVHIGIRVTEDSPRSVLRLKDRVLTG